MSKIYGICLMDCEVVGETRETLRITDLVKIMFENLEEEQFGINLRDENGMPLKFGKHVYLCDRKNICIVPNNLLPFLVDTDYFGRLDVLRFKKKILNLNVRSKGKLQVIHKNDRYLIECLVKYIGHDSLGEGWFVYVELTDFDLHGDSRLYKQLLNQYKNERSTNWLTIRVELLFTEIDLLDSFNERERFSPIYDNLSNLTTTKQSPTGSGKSSNIQDDFGKDKINTVCNINSNQIFNDGRRSSRSTSDTLKPFNSDLYTEKDTTNIAFNMNDRRKENPEPKKMDYVNRYEYNKLLTQWSKNSLSTEKEKPKPVNVSLLDKAFAASKINDRRNENSEVRSNYPHSEIESNEPNSRDFHLSLLNKYSENRTKM